MLFYHNIVFCFERKNTQIYFWQYYVWLSEKYASFTSRPNTTISSLGRYTQVFFITTTCL